MTDPLSQYDSKIEASALRAAAFDIAQTKTSIGDKYDAMRWLLMRADEQEGAK